MSRRGGGASTNLDPHFFHHRGHRHYSFVASDVNELQEIRARQRTFHGAYNRTALGALGYALAILRLFDPRFHRSEWFFTGNIQHTTDRKVTVGLLFVILSALLFIIAFLRSRHSAHDFADRYRGATEFDVCIKTKGQEGGRIYGRPFKTAGWIVIEVTTVVALAEIALLALIVQHKISVSLNHAFRSSTLTKIPLSCQT